jgi:ribulose-phosphate 3-epimerase
LSAIKIAPSILTADVGRLADQVKQAEDAGADYIHLDVMDGHFVPVITLGPLFVRAVRTAVSIPLDVHLMIERPDLQVGAFRDAGADIINVHIEASVHAHRLLGEIRRLGARAGVCINPGTSIAALDQVLAEVDQVMVMAVNPGWGGQAFIESSLDKVKRLRAEAEKRGLVLDIEVDGGVSLETGPRCAAAGANVLVAGSSVYNDRGTIADNLRSLRKAVDAVR